MRILGIISLRNAAMMLFHLQTSHKRYRAYA